MNRKNVVTGVTLPDCMLKSAKNKAKRQHRSFSGYVRHLIERDVAEAQLLEMEQLERAQKAQTTP